MEQLPTYRIMINEDDDTTGVDFISLVSQPAIEENWMAFSSIQFDFQAQKDKRMLFGALMIPDKRIYRNDEKFGEYNVFFTKDDIQSIVKKFSKNNFNNNISFEHMGIQVKGTLIENFIVKEGMIVPGFESIPCGSWMGCVYIEDESFWNNFVKNEIVKGFSIEINGFLSRQDFSKNDSDIWTNIENIVTSDLSDDEMIEMITDEFKKYNFESYNDYPKAASDNAQRAIDLRDQNGLKCGTLVGWQRANQLAKGENISRETIARMASFERHRQNSTGDPKESCGPLMWLAWGGDEGIAWAQRKLKQIDTALNSSAYQSIVNRMSKDSKDVIIVDIDDTLLKDRSKPIQKTIDYINSKYDDHKIEVVSGRNSDELEVTKQQLDDAGLKYDGIHLNQLGTVNSDKHKMKVAENLLSKYKVVEAIDNSDSARKVYSDLGIKVINPINLSSEKFIVEPESGESQDEFVSRCIGIEVNNGYPVDQAAAMCYAKWRE